MVVRQHVVSRRAGVIATWLLVTVVAVGGGFAAGRATLAPPTLTPERSPDPVYTVQEGSVGRSTQFPVGLRWPTRAVGFAAQEGTVTEVRLEAGATVQAGTVLYTVDLRPVVVAAGEVPAFRDLAEGTTGADVRQLQEFLIGQGHLRTKADGKFGAATTAGVRSWQRSMGVEQDGRVGAADLVFVPGLPARLTLTDKVVVGSRLQAGDATVTAITGAPEFTISVSVSAVIPEPGTAVSVTFGESSWSGRIGAATESEVVGETTVLVESGTEEALCGQDCAVLPTVAKPDGVRATVEMVPQVSGPVVPVAALGQDPAGAMTVTAQDGTAIPVTVLATEGSRAVVQGVEVGTVIRVFPGDAVDGDGKDL